ncbi:hypothetical protein DFH27DRAFT_160729 [Peziza echinospora]|nr:hypothetical protein DFH27DRAFT_160729 [Peziza echinospora]
MLSRAINWCCLALLLIQHVGVSHGLDKVAVRPDEILNYALAFRHLQAAYFQTALERFKPEEYAAVAPTCDKIFFDNFLRIRGQQATQAIEVTKALRAFGATAVPACTYQFPVNSAFGFVNLGRIMAGVYVSVVQGLIPYWVSGMGAEYAAVAAAGLISDAQHASYLQTVVGKPHSAYAYHVPLPLSQGWSLLQSLTVSCPVGYPTFPFKTYPAVSVYPTNPTYTDLKPGEKLTIEVTLKKRDRRERRYAAFYLTNAASNPLVVYVDAVEVEGGFEAVIPEVAEGRFEGLNYVFITNQKYGAEDPYSDTILYGPGTFYVHSS